MIDTRLTDAPARNPPSVKAKKKRISGRLKKSFFRRIEKAVNQMLGQSAIAPRRVRNLYPAMLPGGGST
jgi:hypothetical protein